MKYSQMTQERLSTIENALRDLKKIIKNNPLHMTVVEERLRKNQIWEIISVRNRMSRRESNITIIKVEKGINKVLMSGQREKLNQVIIEKENNREIRAIRNSLGQNGEIKVKIRVFIKLVANKVREKVLSLINQKIQILGSRELVLKALLEKNLT